MIFVYKHCFCYLNVQSIKQKKIFVSPANSSLVGILITIGDVTDIFAICWLQLPFPSPPPPLAEFGFLPEHPPPFTRKKTSLQK